MIMEASVDRSANGESVYHYTTGLASLERL